MKKKLKALAQDAVKNIKSEEDFNDVNTFVLTSIREFQPLMCYRDYFY